MRKGKTNLLSKKNEKGKSRSIFLLTHSLIQHSNNIQIIFLCCKWHLLKSRLKMTEKKVLGVQSP